MSFTEYTPSDHLSDYIDAYWVRKADRAGGRRVYADGCADLIANTGHSIVYFNPTACLDQSIAFHPGHIYLGGTMTAYGVVFNEAGGELTGIRFKPGGFFALYGTSMEETVDRVVEFPDPALFALMEKGEGLDTYFLAKAASKPRHDFVAIYQSIYQRKGQISVDDLSKYFHVGNRTMERIFKENVGISPKEFIKIVRFQEVLRSLRQMRAPAVPPEVRPTGAATEMRPRTAAPAPSEESLLRLAFDLGYYDHAHLTNEFKRYAGIRPSELSRFYKTGIAGEQYF